MASRIPGLKLASGFAPYPEEVFDMKARKGGNGKGNKLEGHWMDNHGGAVFAQAEKNYLDTGYAVLPTENQTA
jgi:hypothetical protein